MSIAYHPATDFGNEYYHINDATISYEQFVCKLVKARQLWQQDWEHMIIGICGEAGELADNIKRATIYEKEWDRKNAVEELGDLEFYMAGLRQMTGISRRETLEANVEKLRARYPLGEYSDQAAQERADKQPGLQVIDMSAVTEDSPTETEELAPAVPAAPQP
jgi:NTP pyrophosphatase (non-canonical NTP hydrolase)